MVTGQRVTATMTNKSLEHPENLIVSIQVSLDGFSFFIKKRKDGLCIESKSFDFKNVHTPQRALEEIQKIFEATPSLNQAFEEVIVLYANELFTVVPKALFDENKLTDYLKFNTKILKTDFIVYDEIEALDLVNIYVPYTNINNFFFDHFGTFTYYHSQSILLNSILSNTQNKQAEVFVHFEKTSLTLIAYQGQKLLLSNQFKFETPQDCIYYILFCYEQLQLDPEVHQLTLSGKISEDDANYKLIYDYVREVVLNNNSKEDHQSSFLKYQLGL